METLDLHGVRHHKVELIVENFVLLHDPPVKIITGKSPIMQKLVTDVLELHDYSWDYESFWNLGAIVVMP